MKEADVDWPRRYNMHDDGELLLGPRLGVVKTPTLASFNEIIESHETGKKAANASALANAVKGKGKSHQQLNPAK